MFYFDPLSIMAYVFYVLIALIALFCGFSALYIINTNKSKGLRERIFFIILGITLIIAGISVISGIYIMNLSQ